MRRTSVIAGLLVVLLAAPLRAQVSDVVVEVLGDGVGVGGHVQAGAWTPLQLRMTNQSSQLRSVVARWIVQDEDGDAVFAERVAPLNPAVTQKLWLYAPVPFTARVDAGWTVQVIDAESRRELARHRVSPPTVAGVTETLIGVCGSVDMGLREYEPGFTQHERTKFVRGLMLSNLPDRWYGLSSLHALIWTGEASDPLNDPIDASVTPQVIESLRQWVRRGGHLVLVLPLDQTWSDSPLADLMPVSKDEVVRVDDFDPLMLGALPPGGASAIAALTFDVSAADDPDRAVLAVDRTGRPYVVAKRYGFGRVTAIGVDLTNANVRRLGVPNGQQRVWNRVFNWAAPVYTQDYYEAEVREGRMVSVTARQAGDARLDDMVSGLIAMTGTAAPALLSAILVFALYWVLAGPVAFVVLRRRGMEHHAWLAFVALAGVFTAITWGGAWIMRPAHTSMEHVSFLDVDANTGLVHTRSWLTLLVPKFGYATVAVDPEEAFTGHTIASPGADSKAVGGGFLDPQQYAINAADPRGVTIPVRSTAKRFTLDYLGRLDPVFDGITAEWNLPSGDARMDAGDAWPVAKLTHHLPGELVNVMVIYCPGTLTASGEPRPPWVGFLEKWQAGTTLELNSPPSMNMQPLYRRGADFGPQRLWENEGYLGQIIARHKGRAIDPNQLNYVHSVTDMHPLQAYLLSFFDALPPPSFRDTSIGMTLQAPYERTMLRNIDMTHLLAGRRLILVGQLNHSPLPAPLTLDGEAVESRGLTIVRWVYDL